MRCGGCREGGDGTAQHSAPLCRVRLLADEAVALLLLAQELAHSHSRSILLPAALAHHAAARAHGRHARRGRLRGL